MYCAEQLSLIHAQDVMFTVFYRYIPGIFPGRQEAAVSLGTCSAFTKQNFRNTMQSSSLLLGLNLHLSGPGEKGPLAKFPQRERLTMRSDQGPLSPCTGGAEILYEAVLFKACHRGH